ncbi:MAG TPA: serine/threonine-protein kinase, partial [Victivallales bacterium]|nr:serine/threonine-protein kinase [Victivallales bacterium]
VIFDVNQKAPKLIDFGIAREIEAVHITRDGFVLGTPIYMPPEMFEGEEATIKSDIYSFGATIFHLLTGSPPFVGESSKELYKKHLYEKPRPIKDFRPDIPEVIERLIIEECLAKEPDKRPESMEYVEEKFRNYIKKL